MYSITLDDAIILQMDVMLDFDVVDNKTVPSARLISKLKRNGLELTDDLEELLTSSAYEYMYELAKKYQCTLMDENESVECNYTLGD